MKKIFIFVCLLFTLFLVSCGNNLDTLDKVKNYFNFPIEVTDDLDFPSTINLDGKEISLVWETSDRNVINVSGGVTRQNSEVEVQVSVTATIGSDSKKIDIASIVVLPKEKKKYTISYDLDGGMCDNLITEYYEGEKIYLDTPTKDGYVFLGWYQDKEKVEVVSSGNFNLKARWQEGSSNIVISLSDEVIYVGSEALIYVEGYRNLSCFEITSSDPTVAYVDEDFYLIGLKKGTTIITMRLKEDSYVYGALEVTVLNQKPYIYKDNKPLIIGDKFEVGLSHYDDESLFNITYDQEFLSFNDGFFTTLKEGTTEIKYTLKSDESAYGTLSVVIYPVKPVIEVSSAEMTIGSTTRIDVLNYENNDLIDIVVSANATINGRLITANARGEIEVTVSLKDNAEVKSSLSIHVKPVVPSIALSQSNIIIGSKCYLFIDNLDELDDTDINNYEISLSNNDVVSNDGFTFEGKKNGLVTITFQNKNDKELVSEVVLEVIDTPSVYDDENEINGGSLFIYHKDIDDFDGRIHAGAMDYFEVLGAHDLTKYDWISSNNRAIVVFEDGRYIAVAEGSAVIRVVRKTNSEVVGTINVRIYGEPDVDYVGRLIAIATTQLGYVEGPDNLTKYGAWYGIPNGEWCAMFVSWCANQAGISTEIIPKYAGCTVGREWFESRGQFKYKEEYTPKAGDIIFFLSDGAGHTGIVINCVGNRVYTIEGNTSDTCAKRSYDLNWHTITGYGVPNYPPYSGTSTGGDTGGSSEGGGHSTH